MFNPFPQLFVFSFFAPLLLRLAVACVFATLAWRFFTTREAFASASMPVIGKPGLVLTHIIVAAYTVLAVMLLVGWETQWAALVGAAAALKHTWFANGRYPLYSPHSRSVYVLTTVICLSLLLTGAGAFAFDLPL